MKRTSTTVRMTATAHGTVTARARVRHLLSTSQLWGAHHFASLAEDLEARYENSTWDKALAPRIDEHQAYVIGTILSSTSFLEALINELFADACDHPEKLSTLDSNSIGIMRGLWQTEHFNRYARTLEKFELALKVTDKSSFDKGKTEYQNAQLVLGLRNSLVHFKPEFEPIGEDQTSDSKTDRGKLLKSLRGKFDLNRIVGIEKTRGPFFPDKCLGSGCANWSVKSSFLFAQTFYEKMGLPAPFGRIKDELGL